MPYVKPEVRQALLSGFLPSNPGSLNFVITKAILDYIGLRGESYETLNAAIGVLECAKLELYRRVVAEYESAKMFENGDVYT